MAVLAVGNALNAAAVGFVLPFFSIYAFGRSGAASYVGGIFAASTVLSALGRIVGGELSDRVGRRPVLLAAVAGRSLCFVAMGLGVAADAPLALISAFYLLSSVPRGAFDPACDAMVADVVAPAERPRAYAWLRVARNAGWSAGPLLGGLGGAEHFAQLAVAGGVLGLLSAVHTGLSLAESAQHRVVPRFGWGDLLEAGRDPLFRGHCLLTAGLFLVFAQFLVGVSLDLSRRLALGSTEVGALYSLNGAIIVAGQAAITRGLSRFPHGPVLALGTLCFGVGFLVMGTAAGFTAAVVGVAVVTLGEAITFPLGSALAAELAPADRRGRYLGVYGLAMDAGHGVGQIAGGLGLDAAPADPLPFWAAVAGASVAVAAGFLRLGSALGRRVAEPSAPVPLTEGAADPLRVDP